MYVFIVLTVGSLFAGLLSATESYANPECVSRIDCSANGQCVRGVCHCDPQFEGPRCARFAFEAADLSRGEGLRTIDDEGLQVSSWGGSVLRDDNGTYHMWAAEMVNGVGIKAWLTKSRVIHAVADDPQRPFAFRRADVVFPVFAHEPTVSRAPSGEFVMFFTSNYGQKDIPCTGKICVGYNGTSDLSCPNDQQCSFREPLLTYMSWSTSPYGPWTTPERVPGDFPADYNLACLIHTNSSMICMGRPSLGIMRAFDWKNISTYSKFMLPQANFIGEDPMIWIDKHGVLHAVLHGGGWGSPWGYHYWSIDGGWSWRDTNDIKAYENVVELKGGGIRNFSRRERPHVVFGLDGLTPIGLTTGVTEAWPCTLVDKPVPDRPGLPGSNGTSIWCPTDYSRTLYHALRMDRNNMDSESIVV